MDYRKLRFHCVTALLWLCLLSIPVIGTTCAMVGCATPDPENQTAPNSIDVEVQLPNIGKHRRQGPPITGGRMPNIRRQSRPAEPPPVMPWDDRYIAGLIQAGLYYPGAHVCRSEKSTALFIAAQAHAEVKNLLNIKQCTKDKGISYLTSVWSFCDSHLVLMSTLKFVLRVGLGNGTIRQSLWGVRCSSAGSTAQAIGELLVSITSSMGLEWPKATMVYGTLVS